METKPKYPGKKLCVKCGKNYHPEQYDMCYKCYSEQPARITDVNHEGYQSVSDYEDCEVLDH